MKSRWSWTVIIGVLLVVVAALFWRIEHVGPGAAPAVDVVGRSRNEGATATSGGTTSPVQDFFLFASRVQEGNLQESGTEIIAEGLRKLAGALGTLQIGGLDLTVDLRVAAEYVLLNPLSKSSAATVRQSFVSTAEALEARRQSDQAALRQLAESIRPDMPLQEQMAAVREFFRASAEAMRPLSQER